MYAHPMYLRMGVQRRTLRLHAGKPFLPAAIMPKGVYITQIAWWKLVFEPFCFFKRFIDITY